MPCAKVNICKKSRSAGAKLGGMLYSLPSHELVQSVTAEGVNGLCFHQVALFGGCDVCVKCFKNDARNKFSEIHCLCCRWWTGAVALWQAYPCHPDMTLSKAARLSTASSCIWPVVGNDLLLKREAKFAFKILFDLYD